MYRLRPLHLSARIYHERMGGSCMLGGVIASHSPVFAQVWRQHGGCALQRSGSRREDARDHGGLPGGHEEPQPGFHPHPEGVRPPRAAFLERPGNCSAR